MVAVVRSRVFTERLFCEEASCEWGVVILGKYLCVLGVLVWFGSAGWIG